MSLSSSLGSSGSASSSRPKVNLRSTAVKRIMQEAAELEGESTMDEDFVAAPLEVSLAFDCFPNRPCGRAVLYTLPPLREGSRRVPVQGRSRFSHPLAAPSSPLGPIETGPHADGVV